MKTVNIENWSMFMDGSPLLAPELRKMYLQGNIHNHENFKDGTFVRTSSIQDIDLENGKVTTRNTIYQLGKIDEEYLEFCEGNNVKDLELLRKYKGE